jgi:orotate phosphoribosyltransferase
MATGIAALADPQSGHFDLATGYHGDLWLDLDALFLRPALLRPHVRWLADQLGAHRIDAVCGPVEGGAFLAQAVADTLDTAFLPAYRDPARQPAGYYLLAVTGGISGWRVAITDDAVNAGTAVRACAAELRSQAAEPVAVGALLALGPAPAAIAAELSVPFYAVETMTSQVWPAGDCPLCATGTPLTTRPPFPITARPRSSPARDADGRADALADRREDPLTSFH